MKSTTDLIELVRRLRLIGKYDAAAEAADYLETLSAAPTPPAQPAERKPLTIDQLDSFAEECGFTHWSEWDGDYYQSCWYAFVRLIEAAHGIKGES